MSINLIGHTDTCTTYTVGVIVCTVFMYILLYVLLCDEYTYTYTYYLLCRTQ